jgi:MoxR-like ATPase
MDRFLLHVVISYPDDAAELEVMRLVRSEEGQQEGSATTAAVIPQQAIFEARTEIQQVAMAEAVERYIVALISATRRPGQFGEDVQRWLHVGASPRGTIALDKVSRANAWLHGRDHVTPDDVRAVVYDCLRHRLILSYEANAEGLTTDAVLKEIVQRVAVA